MMEVVVARSEQFTQQEAEVLLHRLDTGCITEALLDDPEYDDLTEAEWETARERLLACEAKLADMLRGGHRITNDDELLMVVLADALEGTTYFPPLRNLHPDEKRTTLALSRSLERKISRLVGRQVRSPLES
mgnify:CR=1 FL=1